MDRLSDDELAYHLRLVEQKKGTDGAWASWSAHLAAKYELGEGEGISEQGQIQRAELPKD